MSALSGILIPLAIPYSAAAQSTRADSTFRWSSAGRTIDQLVIQNMRGDIRVIGHDSDSVTVRATKVWKLGEPREVSIEVSQHRDGTTLLCGTWKGATLACSADGYVVNNDGQNDTRVNFEVSVPRRMQVKMATINGDVGLSRLTGTMNASTVNGDVTIAFGLQPDVDLSVSSVNGRFRSDFNTQVPRHLRRGTTTARLGRGGQKVYLSTVNGELRLVRR